MLNLFFVEFYRIFTLELRYPLNFFSGLIMVTMFFYGLLMGAKYIAGVEGFGTNLDGVLVGYAVWMMAQSGFNNIPNDIQGDARRGTLENIFLSYLDVTAIFFIRALVGSIIGLFFTAIVLTVLLWLTERSVSFTPAILLPAITTIIASIGLGFFAGGIALQAKQIGQALSIAQYPLLFLMMTPFETLQQEIINIAVFLPVVPSAMTLRELMVQEKPLFDTYYLMAMLNSGIYLSIGYMVFRHYVKLAKKKGNLGGH